MEIEFDAAKSKGNARQRNLPFNLVAEFDWEGALILEDERRNYGERRLVALGFLRDRLHVLCFTP